MSNTLRYIAILCLSLVSLFKVSPVVAQETEITDEQAHEIVLNGTPDDVKKLLETGYDVNKVYQCNTLLNSAIKSLVQSQIGIERPEDVLKKIKVLVNFGADVNKSGCQGKVFLPLSWSISIPLQLQKMEQDVYKTINKKIGEGSEYCDWEGLISKPCKDITLEEHKKINIFFQEAYKDSYTMIMPYVMQIMKYLVDNGADVNGRDIQGQTPLHHASIIPQSITVEPVKYLIEKGADINAKDTYSQTPLFFAQGAKNNEVIKILIKAGADEKIRNNVGALYFQAKDIFNASVTMQEDGNIVQEYF